MKHGFTVRDELRQQCLRLGFQFDVLTQVCHHVINCWVVMVQFSIMIGVGENQ